MAAFFLAIGAPLSFALPTALALSLSANFALECFFTAWSPSESESDSSSTAFLVLPFCDLEPEMLALPQLESEMCK